MSNYLHKLPIGAEIDIRGPQIEYSISDDVKEVVFLAGGTGIAPALQVAEYILQRQKTYSSKEARAKIHILWACRSREDCLGGINTKTQFPKTQGDAARNGGRGGLLRWWADISSKNDSSLHEEKSKGIIVQELEALQAQYRDQVTVDYFVDDERTFMSHDVVADYLAGPRASLHSQQSSDSEQRERMVSGNKQKKVVLVSGPDGFVRALAGPKKWKDGKELQGSLGGILAQVNLNVWEVWKL